MSKILASDIEADMAIKTLLEGNVYVMNSSTDKVVLKVYANYERPNTGLADEFLSLYPNGQPQSQTKPFGLFTGYIALSIYSKANSDTTAKKKRMRQLEKQVEVLVNHKTAAYNGVKYYFELTPTPITPLTVSTTTGYSMVVFNILYRTTN